MPLNMIAHSQIKSLRCLLREGQIKFAGNKKLKIYGSLHCASGKRMKKENRIFFENEKEAIQHGYRPCGHCMRDIYLKWKTRYASIQKSNRIDLRY